MRGKREQLVDDRSASRIIPAHAGQTRRGASPRPASPDHPRACGANDLPVLQFTERSGSSPRMRGKHGVERQNRLPDRIIPAHAGQTGCRCWVDGTGSDHPRACGANLQPGREGEADAGSSPRMRGKHRRNHGRNRLGRIIPAHAGQTSHFCTVSDVCPDHPRACGANRCQPEAVGHRHGSSPRMRGKHMAVAATNVDGRIIPAHAGQTRYDGQDADLPADHPRACGANLGGGIVDTAVCGSSPRMRGKRAWLGRPSHWARIIPAHAGQTASR